MPLKNKAKTHLRNRIYHCYNRGLERRDIYYDRNDYIHFENLIANNKLVKNNHKIEIIAYCLMPNHYHILLRQKTKYSMARFFQSINMKYTAYFNWKYKRTGQLWQGTYRAVLVESEKQYFDVIAYIHNNPLAITDHIIKYRFSSYQFYINKIKHRFLKRVRPQWRQVSAG